MQTSFGMSRKYYILQEVRQMIKEYIASSSGLLTSLSGQAHAVGQNRETRVVEEVGARQVHL